MLSRRDYWEKKEAERMEAKAKKALELQECKAELLAKKYDIIEFFKPATNGKKLKARLENIVGKELESCFIKNQTILIDNEGEEVSVKVVLWANGKNYLCVKTYKLQDFLYKSVPVMISDVFEKGVIDTPENILKLETEAECFKTMNFEEDLRYGKFSDLESSQERAC